MIRTQRGGGPMTVEADRTSGEFPVWSIIHLTSIISLIKFSEV